MERQRRVRRYDPETGPSRTAGSAGAPRRVARALQENDGFFFLLLVAYLFFEYGKPAQPLKIPMIISILSLLGWLTRRDKRWGPQTTGFVAFLALMAIGILMAVNNYWAFWTTYSMAIWLLCICAPLPSVLTSVRRIQIWIYMFVAVAVYVAGFAALHSGYGPSGSGGAQDENYVATMMGMALPFAYFSISAETRGVRKVLFTVAIPVFCVALIVAENASRGGFLGLCAVLLYCVARSPRKWMGFAVIALVGLVVFGFAGQQFWDEIVTIEDVHEGTADERLELWTIGMRMLAAHPVFGVGPGSYRWAIGDYQSLEQKAKYGRELSGTKVAHSLFVELLAEMGLTGAIVVAVLLWRTSSDLWQIARSHTGRRGALAADGDSLRLARYADAVIGSILACLVNGVFLSLLYFSSLWILLALASAITQVSRARTAAQQAA